MTQALDTQLFQVILLIVQILSTLLIAVIGFFAKKGFSDLKEMSKSIEELRLFIVEDFVKRDSFHEWRDKVQALVTKVALLEQKSADWDRRSRSA